jgi:membrane protein involved in colicin uptake
VWDDAQEAAGQRDRAAARAAQEQPLVDLVNILMVASHVQCDGGSTKGSNDRGNGFLIIHRTLSLSF